MPMAATSIAAFIAALKKLRPDIQIVDQQWPKLGEPDFTAFITAQMSKKPDAVYCSLFAGDFVTFTKQATPRGYFKAINNRLIDGAEIGTAGRSTGIGRRLSVWRHRRRLRSGDLGRQRTARAQEVHRGPEGLQPSRNTPPAGRSSATRRSTRWPKASRRPATPRATTFPRHCSGLSFDTPVGKRTFSVKSHETFAPEYWGVMVKDPNYPFAIIKDPQMLPAAFPMN